MMDRTLETKNKRLTDGTEYWAKIKQKNNTSIFLC